MNGLFVLLAAAAVVSQALSLDNGVGRTPPLGFNPWNCFGIGSTGKCKLPLPWAPPGAQPCHGFNESVILDVAKAFVATGLRDAGYTYVNLDCGYSTGFRQPNGSLTVNTTRYPNGMKWLGDQIHSLGLKFGMYADAGKTQCCSRLYGRKANDGSLGFEEIDADTFAEWGVDYLKYDACGNDPASYPKMRDALNKTGRRMFYSVHGPTACGDVANTWRTTPDIDNSWDSILNRAITNDGFASSQSVGSWNDPDMLETGNLWGVTGDAEGRSHFAMWAVMKAPLLLGTDVTNMTAATLATVTNRELIRVNQDRLGVQARIVSAPKSTNASSITWAGPLAGGDFVGLVVNNLITAQRLVLDVGTVLGGGGDGKYVARELWSNKTLPGTVDRTSTLTFDNVGPHDSVVVRFSRAA